MAELTPRERLQPSLLDRLTDDEPHERQEAREKRVLSMQKLREVVRRDLEWLFNTGNLTAAEDLDGYPLVASSVLNYGIPGLTGRTASGLDATGLERLLRQAILDFEPRILGHTLKVRLVADEARMNRNALEFEIEGELWGQPMPIRIFLKTEIDLDLGEVTVSERGGRAR